MTNCQSILSPRKLRKGGKIKYLSLFKYLSYPTYLFHGTSQSYFYTSEKHSIRVKYDIQNEWTRAGVSHHLKLQTRGAAECLKPDISPPNCQVIEQVIERFSFECRKVIGFALSTRCDWLKRFAPPFHPIRSKTKANCDALARFSRALRQPHVITSSFDWFNVLSVSYVIGQSNYFGFGFTTLKRKPLYTLCVICSIVSSP